MLSALRSARSLTAWDVVSLSPLVTLMGTVRSAGKGDIVGLTGERITNLVTLALSEMIEAGNV
jgi:hypothetical protein